MADTEREAKAREYSSIVTDLMLIKFIQYGKYGVTLVGEMYDGHTPEELADRLTSKGVKGTLKVTGVDVEISIEERPISIGPIPLTNLGLFVATIFTTIAAGSIMEGVNPLSIKGLISGLPFSATILTILLFHEFGHYFASVRNNVKATLPYFIPAPTFIGTFGAFIKMKSPIMTKKSLMEIGAAGPIAGFLIAVPALFYGLMTSEILPVQPTGEVIHLGDSLIMLILTELATSGISEGYDIYLNSVAFAGWIGLLVTALNLLPIGQLDGGHIAYALFGKKHVIIAKWAFVPMIPLGLYSYNWLIWAALIFFFIKFRHPPVMDENEPLKPFHRGLGYLSIAILVLTFTPIPFY